MEAEWKSRSDFAQFAEAVGVDTLDVLAAWRNPPEPLTVLYTRGIAEIKDDVEAMRATKVFEQKLETDADGVLVKFGAEKEAGTGADFFTY